MKFRTIIQLTAVSFFLLTGCITDPTALTSDVQLPENWQFEVPESLGVDSELLTIAADSAENAGFVLCLLVVRYGAIIAEYYFQGYDINSAHNIRSVSKSFIGALVGLAIQKNFILTEHISIMEYFPEYRNVHFDSRKENILIVHLLTMKSGLEFDEQNSGQFFSGDNWIEAALNFPLIEDPGSKFNYATPLTHLLSAIVTRAVNRPLLDFARNSLFLPLNIEVKEWTVGPQGYYFGGSEMYFTTRDLARFGYLYLNMGQLNGQYILSSRWIERSLQDYVTRDNWNWGAFTNLGYGYLWWLGKLNGYTVQFALGYGGQFIILIPEFDMIIVTTCNPYVANWDIADAHEQWISAIIARYIIPAVNN
jgi:CubicO group peptidase (beta-lactamase class C family)